MYSWNIPMAEKRIVYFEKYVGFLFLTTIIYIWTYVILKYL